MGKWAQGKFLPKNPAKYIGKDLPTYRSSWELICMNYFDNHPMVLAWASESIQIPYYNPFAKRNTIYVPDFFVQYMDKTGNTSSELIEVKPRKEAIMEKARSRKDKLSVLLNEQKWLAAKAWCRKAGVNFRILTEEEIFRGMK